MAAEKETLSAGQRGKIRRLSEPKELSPEDEGGELNVVPFLDIIMNVLIFVLATVSVTFISMIDTEPPKASSTATTRDQDQQALQLTIIIGNDGYIVTAEGKKFAAGCESKIEGETKQPTIGVAKDPKTGNVVGPDYAALTDCVTKLKRRSPSYAQERQATITANGDVQYQTVVNTLDAIRGAPPVQAPPPNDKTDVCDIKNGCLFDQVIFSIP